MGCVAIMICALAPGQLLPQKDERSESAKADRPEQPDQCERFPIRLQRSFPFFLSSRTRYAVPVIRYLSDVNVGSVARVTCACASWRMVADHSGFVSLDGSEWGFRTSGAAGKSLSRRRPENCATGRRCDVIRVPPCVRRLSADIRDTYQTNPDENPGSADVRQPAYSRRGPDAGRNDRNLKGTTVEHFPPT